MGIMVDQTVPVVLQADVILHRKSHGRPGMGFKLGTVDKIFGFSQYFRDKDVIAQSSLMLQPVFYLLLFVETIPFDLQPPQHLVVTGAFKSIAGGNGDAASFSHRQFGHRAVFVHIAQGQQNAFGKFGACKSVVEQGAAGDEIRFQQCMSGGLYLQLLQAFTDDGPDSGDMISIARPDDNPGPGCVCRHWIDLPL